ncbi:MAG: DNA-methyltransferase [Gammaproteobacteria bacterium]
MTSTIAVQANVAFDKSAFWDKVHCGNCADVLRRIPAASVDAVVTSPPYYRQRDYEGIGIGNEDSVSEYIAALLAAFGEVVRVVKPTGNIVYNLGDKYLRGGLLLAPYRFALAAVEKFPVSLVNNITWVKRNPTPRQYKRRLVSSTEPFFHFVKSDDYYYARDEFMNGSGYQGDFGRMPSKPVCKPGLKLGQKYRELLSCSSLSAKQKILGHRVLDEAIAEVRSGTIEGFRMKIRGIHAPAFGGQDGGRNSQMRDNGFTLIRIRGEKMKRDIIESAVASGNGSGHSAVYPLPVIRELIRLLCPPGGVVLDHYAGSGTTLVAARREGRHYIGVDINAGYCRYARKWALHG